MKKLFVLFLSLLILPVFNLSASNVFSVNNEEVEEFTILECTLRPMERKASHFLNKHQEIKTQKHLSYAQSNSLNWSGYVAVVGHGDNLDPTYGSVSSVSGKWKVPKVEPTDSEDTYSAVWVGIDGFINQTVEQIGTAHDIVNGSVQYYAWFNLYPVSTQVIEGFPVKPGDEIEASVEYQGEHEGKSAFKLSIRNLSKKTEFSTIQYTIDGFPAHRSSAEWIVEAPGVFLGCDLLGILPLANFEKITFKDCKTEIDGVTGSIGNKHWTNEAIDMVTYRHGDVRAKASPLNKEGTGFSVLWLQAGVFPFIPVEL